MATAIFESMEAMLGFDMELSIAEPAPWCAEEDTLTGELLFPFTVVDDDCSVRFDMPTPPLNHSYSMMMDERQPLVYDLPLFSKSLSVDSGVVDSSAVFELTYPTPIATPAQSVPSSPQLSPCRSPSSTKSADCIEPAKLFAAGESLDDSDIEIDVVTVDEEKAATAGTKRSWSESQAAAPAKTTSASASKASQSSSKKSKSGSSTVTTVAAVAAATVTNASSSGATAAAIAAAVAAGATPGRALDIETRRHVHNVLERRRREDLKSSFDGLRATIPDMEPNDKSPKVAILKGATDYITLLKTSQKELLATKENLATDNARLISRLRLLQARLN